MYTYLMIALGGSIGAVFRYGIFSILSDYENMGAPMGVLFVNIVGSFLIGLSLSLSQYWGIFNRHSWEHSLFVTGFLGALTTFSTFSQDNIKLLINRNILGFSFNILSNIGLCLLATYLGYVLISKN